MNEIFPVPAVEPQVKRTRPLVTTPVVKLTEESRSRATDVITVYASSASQSFNAFGSEIA